MRRRAWLLVLGLFAVGAAVPAWSAGEGAPDYTELRAARAQSLMLPDGWFSLVALEKLQDGDTQVGSAQNEEVVVAHVPAHLLTLHKQGEAITFAAVDPTLAVAGRAASAGARVNTGDEDAAHAMRSGAVLLWVIDRGGEKYLRVKDAQAPARLHFHGLAWYKPEARYRVQARWVPYSTPHTLDITNKLGQVRAEPVPGYAEFLIDGRTERLTPTVEGGALFFVFRDATSRLETDGGGRFLTTPAPSYGMAKEGTVELDFNQAVNPPCAYSPFATCPLAPRENRLPVAIPAGEKRYDDLPQSASR